MDKPFPEIISAGLKVPKVREKTVKRWYVEWDHETKSFGTRWAAFYFVAKKQVVGEIEDQFPPIDYNTPIGDWGAFRKAQYISVLETMFPACGVIMCCRFDNVDLDPENAGADRTWCSRAYRGYIRKRCRLLMEAAEMEANNA